jgi:uncharacterized protein
LEESNLITNHNEKQDLKPVKRDSNYSVNTIDLFLSQICNLSCIYCFERNNESLSGNNIKFMDSKTAERSIDFLINISNDNNNLHVCFFGGEPLLNFKILKHTVLYAERLGDILNKKFFFSLTTNATLLRDEVISFLIKHKIRILISLDGDLQTHNANRPFSNGTGSYSQIIKNLKKLRKNKFDYSARATVTLKDINNINSNYKHLLSLGFNNIHFEHALGKNGNFQINSDIDIEVIKKQYYLIAKKIISNYKSGRKFSFTPITKSIGNIISGLKMNYSCFIGRGYLAIDVDGDIYLCHRLVGNRTFIMGNVMDDSYDTKWFDIIHNEMDVDDREKCSICWAKYLCGGGCYALNYENNQDIRIPLENYCKIIKYSIEMALMIYCKVNVND